MLTSWSCQELRLFAEWLRQHTAISGSLSLTHGASSSRLSSRGQSTMGGSLASGLGEVLTTAHYKTYRVTDHSQSKLRNWTDPLVRHKQKCVGTWTGLIRLRIWTGGRQL